MGMPPVSHAALLESNARTKSGGAACGRCFHPFRRTHRRFRPTLLATRSKARVLLRVEYLVWTLTLTLMLIGLIGAVVPILPSTLLILGAALIHKLALPGSFSWMAFGWIAFFFLISILVDIGCTLLGTRLFGGTKWGMAGAGGGAMVGMFFSLPGLILSTIFGAMAAEKIGAKRTNREALRSGAGAAVGFVLATIARLICAAIMIGLFLFAALSG